MANVVEIIISARNDAAKAFAAASKDTQALKRDIGSLEAPLRNMSLVALGFGAAITGALGLAVKAANEEARGIRELDGALRNVGTSYAAMRDQIEANVESIQRLTNFSDGELRSALSRLVTITGDYDSGLKGLNITTDLAARLNMDLDNAALIVGKALSGNTEMLRRYGIQMKEGATQTEVMAALTRQFGGAAQASADPFKQMGNAIQNTGETIGAILLPVVSKAAGFIKDMAERLNSVNPAALTAGVAIAAVVGVIATVGGTIGLTLIMISKFIMGVSEAIAALNALGLAGALAWAKILGGILLVIAAAEAVTQIMKKLGLVEQSTLQVVGEIIGRLTKSLNEGVVKGLDLANDATVGLAASTAEAAKRVRELAQAQEQAAEATKEFNDAVAGARSVVALTEQYNALFKSYRDAITFGLLKPTDEAAKRIVDRMRSLVAEITKLLQDPAVAQQTAIEFAIKNIGDALDDLVKRQKEDLDALVRQGEQYWKDRAAQQQEADMVFTPGFAPTTIKDVLADFLAPVTRFTQESGMTERGLGILGAAQTPGQANIMAVLTRANIDLVAYQRLALSLIESGMSDADALAGAVELLIQNVTRKVNELATSMPGGVELTGILKERGVDIFAILQALLNGVTGTIPRFAQGGVVPGPMNAPRLIMAHGGERVTPVGAGVGNVIINIYAERIDTSLDFERAVGRAMRDLRTRGGGE